LHHLQSFLLNFKIQNECVFRACVSFSMSYKLDYFWSVCSVWVWVCDWVVLVCSLWPLFVVSCRSANKLALSLSRLHLVAAFSNTLTPSTNQKNESYGSSNKNRWNQTNYWDDYFKGNLLVIEILSSVMIDKNANACHKHHLSILQQDKYHSFLGNFTVYNIILWLQPGLGEMLLLLYTPQGSNSLCRRSNRRTKYKFSLTLQQVHMISSLRQPTNQPSLFFIFLHVQITKKETQHIHT